MQFLCALRVNQRPVLRGWRTLPNFQNHSFTNELYATLQTPAPHRRDYFWYEISSFKSQDVSTQTGADECVCFAYSHMQVEGEHTCLHPAGLRILRCVQTIALLLSPPKKAEQTTRWMLGKWFAQFIHYFTLFYLKNSKRIGWVFFLKPPQNQNSFSDEFSCLEGNIAAGVCYTCENGKLSGDFLAALTFLL